MGIGDNKFKSLSSEYSSPRWLVDPLVKEFGISFDVCASAENTKCEKYFTKEDDALNKSWIGNCWMNPPFGRNLGKWVLKAHSESKINVDNKVCLIPVRSNTKWWAKVCKDSEIRFVIGELIFNEQNRGLWLPMCIMIFGRNANNGHFSTILIPNKKL